MASKIIIISSPSGAGKTTICKKLLSKLNNLKLSISYTTRTIRKGEKNKKDYYFVKKNQFIKLKKKNFFIETAIVFGNHYGSPHKNINKVFKLKKNILFDIDWQGAKKIRKKFPKGSIIDFFILPPNKKELKTRLIQRGRDNRSEIKKRLSLAVNEIKHFKEYKYVLVNDNINKTVKDIIAIINHENLLDEILNKIKKVNIH